MDLVENIHKVLNEASSQFTTVASLDVHVDSPDVLCDGPAKIQVGFDAEVEYRSWGIKGIDVSVSGNQAVVMQFNRGEEEFEKEVVLNFDAAEIDVEAGGGSVTVTSVSVVLDPNFVQRSLTVTVRK